MKTLLLRFIRTIYTIGGIMFLVMLAACSVTDDDSVSDVQQTPTETVVREKSQTAAPEPPSFDNYEDYMDYLSDIPAFEPYYKTVFTFEEISGGTENVPIEQVKAMYDEMKTEFDYVLVSEYPLFYRGKYEGESNFVDGYEQYQSGEISNPVNVVSSDWEGNEILTTPLKTILLGEDTSKHFDSSIESGRNLQMSDFTLTAPNEPINVVLGSAYKDIYELGDMFSLELISEVMYFQGVGFSNEVAAQNHVNFDYTIVMPAFVQALVWIGMLSPFYHQPHMFQSSASTLNHASPFHLLSCLLMYLFRISVSDTVTTCFHLLVLD